jgi:adhesin transport system outer membrane protein
MIFQAPLTTCLLVRALRRVRNYSSLVAILAATLIPQYASAQTESLALLFVEKLDQHPRIQAAIKDVEAAQQNLKIADDAFYPSLALNGSYGFEHLERKNKNQTEANTSELSPQDLKLSLRQNLFKGGADKGSFALSSENLKSSQASLETLRQSILLQMLSAYVNVQRFDQLLALARLSIENIQRQTELENTRIERGRGYNTDLLQAKSQLAEARARMVRAQKGLTQSVNVYRNLFQEIPKMTNASSIIVSKTAIPDNLDTAVSRALANSLLIKNARLNVSIAEHQISIARGQRLGALDAVLSVRTRENIEGSESSIFDYSAKIEYNLSTKVPSFGGHASQAAALQLEAARKLEASSKRDVVLSVRQAWADFQTSQEVAEIETHRALIAEEFLHLARRERELNRRSLLEVLSGETNLYAARIQSISADADKVIASYSLLQSMGLLRPGVIVSKLHNKEDK